MPDHIKELLKELDAKRLEEIADMLSEEVLVANCY